MKEFIVPALGLHPKRMSLAEIDAALAEWEEAKHFTYVDPRWFEAMYAQKAILESEQFDDN